MPKHCLTAFATSATSATSATLTNPTRPHRLGATAIATALILTLGGGLAAAEDRVSARGSGSSVTVSLSRSVAAAKPATSNSTYTGSLLAPYNPNINPGTGKTLTFFDVYKEVRFENTLDQGWQYTALDVRVGKRVVLNLAASRREPTPQEIAEEVTVELRELPLLTSPKNGEVAVGSPVYAFFEDAAQDFEVKVLGVSVKIHAEPKEILWDWGDSSSETGSDPGAPWPEGKVRHSYLKPADLRIEARTQWEVSYSFPGGEGKIEDPVETTSRSREMRVAYLVPFTH